MYHEKKDFKQNNIFLCIDYHDDLNKMDKVLLQLNHQHFFFLETERTKLSNKPGLTAPMSIIH